MKAKIVGGEFDGVEFKVSDKTVENIKEKIDGYYDVKEYCRKNKVYTGYQASFVVAKDAGHNHVRVPLPNANDLWTFAAFDWVKAFCEHFEGKYTPWPHHTSHLDCVNYLWIKV